MKYYVLSGKEVKEATLDEFSSQMKNNQIASTMFGDVHVSTVFLGIDHGSIRGSEKPILFETMIFGGEHDGYLTRYTSYDDAVKGHEIACKAIKS
jgi:hypothetical protein